MKKVRRGSDMAARLKTIVLLQDERHRKEYRYILGRAEVAKIEQEILLSDSLLSQENLEEIGSAQPDVVLLDMLESREQGLRLLEQVHKHFASTPIVVVGSPIDPSFLIQSMKLGVEECLPKPLTQEELSEAFHRVHRKIYGDGVEKSLGAIFTFISSKGGVGSTTLLTNFAVCLSKTSKKRVLIVDLDVQLGDTADYFGVKDNRYLFKGEPEESTWESDHVDETIVQHASTGVDILSLTCGFSRKSRPFPHQLKRLLTGLKDKYDFILVDAANGLDSNIVAALDLSDSIFLVSKGDLPALRNAQRFLHTFLRLGYSQSRLHVIVNRYSKNDGIDLTQMERALGFQIFWTIPNDFKSMISSIQKGVPLTATTRRLPLAKTLYDLSAQILGLPVSQQPKPPSAGLFSRVGEGVSKSVALTTLDLSNS